MRLIPVIRSILIGLITGLVSWDTTKKIKTFARDLDDYRDRFNQNQIINELRGGYSEHESALKDLDHLQKLDSHNASQKNALLSFHELLQNPCGVTYSIEKTMQEHLSNNVSIAGLKQHMKSDPCTRISDLDDLRLDLMGATRTSTFSKKFDPSCQATSLARAYRSKYKEAKKNNPPRYAFFSTLSDETIVDVGVGLGVVSALRLLRNEQRESAAKKQEDSKEEKTPQQRLDIRREAFRRQRARSR